MSVQNRKESIIGENTTREFLFPCIIIPLSDVFIVLEFFLC